MPGSTILYLVVCARVLYYNILYYILTVYVFHKLDYDQYILV